MEYTFFKRSFGYERVGADIVALFKTNPFYWLGVTTYNMKGETPGLDPNDRPVDYHTVALDLTLLGFSVTFTFALLGKGHRFRNHYENRNLYVKGV
jgi:hypothetical protein